METSAPPSLPRSSSSPGPLRAIFQHLKLVLGVAFLIATLFTAWTPNSLQPQLPDDTLNLSAALPPTPLPPDWPTSTPRPRPLIGIVVGHWGDNNDPGAVCADSDLTEFKVNQNIATLVMKELVAQGYDVDLLKEFDPRLQGYQATALVSIHADSCDYVNDQATGFKVASAMASPHPERAARLAACLRSRYGQMSGLPLHSNSVTRDMTSYHAFGEIHEETTAAIIETGFLNLDRSFLTEKPDVAAAGIVSGVLCFLNNEDVASPAPPAASQPTP